MIENLIHLIDKYMNVILITSAVALVLLFLIRSFRRSMLIEHGQARFVIESYDVSSARLYKWLFWFILLVAIPVLVYVKYRVAAP